MNDLGGSLLAQLLNGLAYSMLLFLLAAGLSIIFGMMDVLNLTHGSFFMLGAYLGLSAVRETGSFWLALALAPTVVGLGGAVFERLLLRPIYQRGHLDQVLLTFGFVFIFLDVTRLAWGADVHAIQPPPALAASIPLGGRQFPVYRLFVIGIGVLLAAVLWFVQERTRLGAILRAGVSDRQMVSALGIDVQAVFTLVFGAGAALAAFSGVVAGPILGMSLGMDFDILIFTLIVVVVGGLGTLSGSFWGAIVIGLADTFGKVLLPEFALFLIFVVMAIVLLVRPGGLFGRGVA